MNTLLQEFRKIGFKPVQAGNGNVLNIRIVRIVFFVVLVVVLGRVEGLERSDLGDDRPGQAARIGESLLRRFCRAPLLVPFKEDGGPVLASPVAELPALIQRIDGAQEQVQQLQI